MRCKGWNRDELDAQAQDPAQTFLLRFYRANTGEMPVRFYGGTQPAGVITRGGGTSSVD